MAVDEGFAAVQVLMLRHLAARRCERLLQLASDGPDLDLRHDLAESVERLRAPALAG
jgi:hypothetical protein